MALDLQAKLAEELTCKICLDRYKDPRELPCRHSFCNRCLKKVKVVHMPLSCGGVGHGLACPLCRRNHPVPTGGVEGFPKDFKLDGLLEILKQHEKEEKSNGEERTECATPPTPTDRGNGADIGNTPKGSDHQLPASCTVSSGNPDPYKLEDGIQQLTLTDSSVTTASETQTDASTDPPEQPAILHPDHHWYSGSPDHPHPPPHHHHHPHPPPHHHHHPHPPPHHHPHHHPHPPPHHHPHPPPHHHYHPHPPPYHHPHHHPHHRPHPPPHHHRPHHHPRPPPHHVFGPRHFRGPRPPFPHGRGCHQHP